VFTTFGATLLGVTLLGADGAASDAAGGSAAGGAGVGVAADAGALGSAAGAARAVNAHSDTAKLSPNARVTILLLNGTSAREVEASGGEIPRNPRESTNHFQRLQRSIAVCGRRRQSLTRKQGRPLAQTSQE
jgi:hypothetical protein